MSMTQLPKRLLSFAVIAAMLVSLFGCTQSGTPQSGVSNTAAETSQEEGGGGSGETVTLTRWGKMDSNRIAPNYDNFGNMIVYEEMEKQTGIKIEFIHPPVGQEPESFNLLMASGSYPDMIYYDWCDKVPGGPQKFIDDGILLDLGDIIDQHAPNLKKFLDENPDVRKEMSTDEGSIYAFPNVYPYWQENPTIQTNRGYQLRGDWLEELGLSVPTTMDDWYHVLTAFKEKGEGDGGETIYPLVSRNMSLTTSAVRMFANAWNGLDYDFYVQDNQVKYGPIEPAFRNYVETMALWYGEGLIDPEFANYQGKEHDARVTSSTSGAWLSGLGAGMGIYIVALGSDDSKVVGAPFPVASQGDRAVFNSASNSSILGYGTAITSQCKNVELAAKWLDYHYSEEGTRLLNWGVEGLSHEIGDDGLPYFTELVTNNPDGLSMDVAIGKYCMIEIESFLQDPRVMEARMLNWDTQKESSRIWDEADFSMRWPAAVTLTSDEGAELAAIMSDINTYRDESFLRFMMGVESMDNYDKFVNQINSMNIERAIAIRQQALDRYLERMA